MAAAQRRIPFPAPVSTSPMAIAADCRDVLGPVPAGPSFFPEARARRRALGGIAATVLACIWPAVQVAAQTPPPAEVVNTFPHLLAAPPGVAITRPAGAP